MNKYETRLACGQLCWMMKDNRVVCKPVERILIEDTYNNVLKKSETLIQYGFRVHDTWGSFKHWDDLYDNECFVSKEALLASL